MSRDSKALGRLGEKEAAAFLKSRGYKIVTTNFRTRRAEIDIIAQDGDYICFIEVKTRMNLYKGRPKEAVTYSKQKKIILGASIYLNKKGLADAKVRFDVVEALENKGRLDISLIKNAFQAF